MDDPSTGVKATARNSHSAIWPGAADVLGLLALTNGVDDPARDGSAVILSAEGIANDVGRAALISFLNASDLYEMTVEEVGVDRDGWLAFTDDFDGYIWMVLLLDGPGIGTIVGLPDAGYSRYANFYDYVVDVCEAMNHSP